MKRHAGKYRVIGRRHFRGHRVGATFEAIMDPEHERRAILRGDIELLEKFIPSIRRGTYTLPAGWVNPRKEEPWQK